MAAGIPATVAGRPFKGQIGRDDQTRAFIGPADHIEEQFGSGLRERDVTQFVQDEVTAGRI